MGFLSDTGLARFWAGVKGRFVAVEDRVGIVEDALENDLLDLIARSILDADKKKHPIGTILSSTSDVNPAAYMGFGTWEAWGAGRVPVGMDVGDADFGAVEKTGGAKSVSHTHTYTFNYTGSGTSGSTTPGAGGSTTPGATGSTTPGTGGSTTPGATGATTLSIAQMPAHAHSFARVGTSGSGTVNWFGGPGGYTSTGFASLGITGVDAQTTTSIAMNNTGGGGSHTHTSAAHAHTGAAHTHTSAAHTHTGAAHTHSTPDHTHTGSNSNTTVSALQPYITCYMWKRTA